MNVGGKNRANHLMLPHVGIRMAERRRPLDRPPIRSNKPGRPIPPTPPDFSTETQPDREIPFQEREVYSRYADSLIAAPQIVAIHLQTIAAANDYWRDQPTEAENQ